MLIAQELLLSSLFYPDFIFSLWPGLLVLKLGDSCPMPPLERQWRDIIAYPGFSIQCKNELLSGSVSFSPFCSREPKVNKCLYHEP